MVTEAAAAALGCGCNRDEVQAQVFRPFKTPKAKPVTTIIVASASVVTCSFRVVIITDLYLLLLPRLREGYNNSLKNDILSDVTF